MDKVIFIKSKSTLHIATTASMLLLVLTVLIVTLSIIENMLWFLGLLIVPIGFIGVAVYLFFSELTNIEIDDTTMIERYKLTGKVKKRLNISDIQSIERFCTPFAPPLITFIDRPKEEFGFNHKNLFSFQFSQERILIVKEVCGETLFNEMLKKYPQYF